MDRLANGAVVVSTLIALGIAVWSMSLRLDSRVLSGARVTVMNDSALLNQLRSPELSAVPVQVVVFSDYRCPHCARAQSVMKAAADRHPDLIGITWRHFPILGPRSYQAALVAECARNEDAFEAVHARLFDLMADTIFRPFSDATAKFGLDETALLRCMNSTTPNGRVEADRALAARLFIHAVPTVILDTLMFVGTPPPDFLDRYLRRATKTPRRSSSP